MPFESNGFHALESSFDQGINKNMLNTLVSDRPTPVISLHAIQPGPPHYLTAVGTCVEQ